MALLPELSVLFFSVVFLFASLGTKKRSLYTLAQLLAFLVLVVTVFSVGQRGSFFFGAYRIDLFSQILKILIAYGFSLVLFMLPEKEELEDGYKAEFFMFVAFSALGLMMLISSVELISIVLALEISSYSLYVAIPLRKNAYHQIQLEATMKYLFFGAISTGVMLYGMGYIYAIAGSTFLADIVAVFPSVLSEPLAVLAVVLTMVGFFFKLSLFPMHFWAPDVYEGASNTTATFIATVPKIAAAALLIRIASFAVPPSPQIVLILTILAGFSMTVGNIVGLVQKDIKRLLAYSGIAHAGYLIIGLIAFNREGFAAVIFYSAVYLVMNLGVFYVVMLLSRTGENVYVDDLSGLARRAPLLAFTLAVSAFSLAGIPPTGGFTGKLFLLTSAFREGHLAIVIIGAVNTVISIFYYLNLVRMSYSKEIKGQTKMALTVHEKLLCCMVIFVLLYMGMLPYGLFEILRFSL